MFSLIFSLPSQLHKLANKSQKREWVMREVWHSTRDLQQKASLSSFLYGFVLPELDREKLKAGFILTRDALPYNYKQSCIPMTITDENGRWFIANVRPGYYSISGACIGGRFVVMGDKLGVVESGAIADFGELDLKYADGFDGSEFPATPKILKSTLTSVPTTQSSPQQSYIQQGQECLRAAGFDPGPVDGSLGPRTRTPLRRYQSAQGLPVTGEFDAATKNALGIE
jgi:hypothetical protein